MKNTEEAKEAAILEARLEAKEAAILATEAADQQHLDEKLDFHNSSHFEPVVETEIVPSDYQLAGSWNAVVAKQPDTDTEEPAPSVSFKFGF